jgi:hypothetical protein
MTAFAYYPVLVARCFSDHLRYSAPFHLWLAFVTAVFYLAGAHRHALEIVSLRSASLPIGQRSDPACQHKETRFNHPFSPALVTAGRRAAARRFAARAGGQVVDSGEGGGFHRSELKRTARVQTIAASLGDDHGGSGSVCAV